jgi:hypothetical protein
MQILPGSTLVAGVFTIGILLAYDKFVNANIAFAK